MSNPSVSLCGRQLDQPGHICAFFDSRTEQYDILAPYYMEGLAQGEQVITIVDAHEHGAHCTAMGAHGIPVNDALMSGQLKVLTAEDTYTSGGRFGATRMYNLLQGALADAHRQNMRVRTSGVMDWATQGHAGTEELMDYEARVNVLVPTYNCTLLCVYDLNEISGRMVMDVLATHPYIVHRREVKENPYYVPPIDMLRQVLLEKVEDAAASASQRATN